MEVGVLGRVELRIRHRPNQVGDRLGEGAERGDRALAGVLRPGVGQRGHHHEPAVMLLRHERHRGRRHHVDDRRELLRRGLGLGDERGDHLGRRGQEQHPADDRPDLVQAKLEPGRNAEVAAAPADRPEEIRVRLGVGADELAVGRHQLGREQVVDREAVLADEEAGAAAERDAADPDGAGVAEAGREAVGAGGIGVLARRQARLGPGGASLEIDLERPHAREVEHDPALRDAVPGAAVTAAAHGELEPAIARKGDDVRDVGRVGDPRDQCGPAVDRARRRPCGRCRSGSRRARSPCRRGRIRALSGRSWWGQMERS